MICFLVRLCPPLWRWVLQLRPHHRHYQLVRRVLEFAWIRSNMYHADWDAQVSIHIDLGMVTAEDGDMDHTIHVGEYEVWISNFPYACGEPVLQRGANGRYISTAIPWDLRRARPSLMTLYRLRHAARAARRARADHQKHMQQMENQHVR